MVGAELLHSIPQAVLWEQQHHRTPYKHCWEEQTRTSRGFFPNPNICAKSHVEANTVMEPFQLQETLQETIPSPLYGIFGTSSKMLLLKSQWQTGCSVGTLALPPPAALRWIVMNCAMDCCAWQHTSNQGIFISGWICSHTENPIQYLHQKWT